MILSNDDRINCLLVLLEQKFPLTLNLSNILGSKTQLDVCLLNQQ